MADDDGETFQDELLHNNCVDAEEVSRQRKSSIFCGRFRYFILFLSWLCLTSISSNMLALNFTLICMGSSPTTNGTATAATDGRHSEPSLVHNPQRFIYSSQQKNQLMWAVAVGSMLGTFPFSWLYTHFGARFVLFGAGLASAVATALIPTAASISFHLFLALRFVQGISYSADFAAMGMICSRWASLKQNALFISVLTCYSPLSTTITNPVSGMICESRFGWPMVYYVHAFACTLLFLLWLCFYNDHPRTNRFVSDSELEKIHRDKSRAHIEMDKFVPYKEILRSRLIWVVWLNAFADLFSGVFLLMYIPTYLNYVLHYGIEKTGFLGALPSLSHIPLKFLFGYCSDKFKCLPERAKLILFNTIAVGVPAIAYLAIGFIPVDRPLWTVLTFTAILMLLSTAGGGFYKCGTLCSRQYSHFVVANIQFVKSLTLFVGPALMWLFVDDETDRDQWRNVFMLLAAMLILANVLFAMVATDQPASFTQIHAAGAKSKLANGEEEKAQNVMMIVASEI
uniref:MFS domain-containing protein n=1 Tax=Globodera pallida TaxID=36090 RepID=A0A183BUK4_GLOPA